LKASLKCYWQLPFYGLLLQPKECHTGAVRAKELQNPAVPFRRPISVPFSPKRKATIKSRDSVSENLVIYLKLGDNSPEHVFLKSASPGA